MDQMAIKCGVCDKPASDHQHIECEICDASYHLKCVDYTHAEYKIWSLRENIFYMCDGCKNNSTVQQYRELKKVMMVIQQYTHKIDECVQSQTGLINTIGRGVTLYNENCGKFINAANDSRDSVANAAKKIEDHVEKIEEAILHISGQPREFAGPTYADVLRATGKAKPICIIRPKEDCQDEASTRSEIKSIVDPTKISVSGLRSAGSGGVAVMCDDADALEKVREIVEKNLSERYEVAAAKVMLPRLKLVGLSEEWESDKLRSLLVSQNGLSVNPDDLRVVTTRAMRNRRGFDVVLEAPPAVYRDLIARERVKLGWDMCRVLDGTDVRRCATCCGYSHLKTKCPEKRKICLRCAGSHEVKHCQSERVCCVNCKRASEREGRRMPLDHFASDRKCPIFMKFLRRMRERIGFD